VRPGQKLVSALIVAMLALKTAEGWFRLERWPLTNVPMFSVRVPPERLLWRVTLSATTGGSWFELGPLHLGLNKDDFGRRVPAEPLVLLPGRCGELGRIYNQAHPGKQLTALQARVTKVLRPGLPDQVPEEHTVDCPLGPPKVRR